MQSVTEKADVWPSLEVFSVYIGAELKTPR